MVQESAKVILREYQQKIQAGIVRFVPAASTNPECLHQAMWHSLNAGGKRLRPILTMASAELWDAADQALSAGVAIECLHTYSLIHDDLPCMDDSDLRRGQPACHIAFDEATALLAGDALLTLAFELLGKHYKDIRLVAELAQAAGSQKLIGGQVLDLAFDPKHSDAQSIETIHLGKTAALIEASFVMGGIIGAADTESLSKLRQAGRCLGLGFQIIDDILDMTQDRKTLGKHTDADENKPSFARVFGLEAARAKANDYSCGAIAALQSLNKDTAFLEALVRQMEERIY